MSLTYSYIRETCVQGVIRGSLANPISLDRVRAQFDAAFFSINSTVAQAYAAREDRRELLRVATTLTFTDGDADLPEAVLKGYIEDATFTVTSRKYSYRRYPDWLPGGDPRLGMWTQIGETLKAKTPTPVAALTGDVEFSSICSPAIPSTESATYVAPDDFYPDFVNAMVQYIIGQTMETAAKTA